MVSPVWSGPGTGFRPALSISHVRVVKTVHHNTIVFIYHQRYINLTHKYVYYQQIVLIDEYRTYPNIILFNLNITSLLVPGDPGGQEHPFTYLPWKPATRAGKAQFMYAVTVETPRPGQGRHAHLLSDIWNFTTRGGKAQFMYEFSVESPRSKHARQTRFGSYRRKLAMREGKAYSFT
jgi:hypothetical protein